jgi:hypothetical protein
MANMGEIYSVIVAAQNANTTAHTYSEVYGGSVGCSIAINSVVISVGAASNFNVLVNTVSGGTGCYLLGENKNVYTGSPNLGSTSVN